MATRKLTIEEMEELDKLSEPLVGKACLAAFHIGRLARGGNVGHGEARFFLSALAKLASQLHDKIPTELEL